MEYKILTKSKYAEDQMYNYDGPITMRRRYKNFYKSKGVRERWLVWGIIHTVIASGRFRDIV